MQRYEATGKGTYNQHYVLRGCKRFIYSKLCFVWQYDHELKENCFMPFNSSLQQLPIWKTSNERMYYWTEAQPINWTELAQENFQRWDLDLAKLNIRI